MKTAKYRRSHTFELRDTVEIFTCLECLGEHYRRLSRSVPKYCAHCGLELEEWKDEEWD